MTEPDQERPPEPPPFRIPSGRPPGPAERPGRELKPPLWTRRRAVQAEEALEEKPPKTPLFDQDTVRDPSPSPPPAGRQVRPWVGRDAVAPARPPVAPSASEAPPPAPVAVTPIAAPDPPVARPAPSPAPAPVPVAPDPPAWVAPLSEPDPPAEPEIGDGPVATPSGAVQWARTSLATLGELNGRRLDRRAVDVNEHRIGKLEPEWSVPRRIRSLIILVLLTLFVAAVIAAVLALAAEILSVAVNHAVSKSAGA